MKMVDAFGNEIPSSPEMLPALREEDNSPATEEEIQLLRSIARQIPLIAKEFNDESMSMTAPEPLRSLQEILEEKDRTIDLKEASKLARAERARLHRQLQLLRNGEESLSQEIGRLEGVVRAATPPPDLETVQTNRRWGKWFVMILMTQTVAIIIFVKMVSLRARYMFLTTYYDPHFPALYEPLIPTGWDISSTFGPHSLSLVDGAAHSSVLDTFLHLASEIFYSILAFFFGMKTLDFTLPPPQRLPS
ncbi:uncharacterized protein EI90DRAFT_925471 [Cantharellus anzutake]|uniref:uncharacterized protein n=1 Tax=Cantharellus anzutake TaxID=1750568 RepID=UPI00190501F5|nr:uncharacterized protein EI90DRAFT_925471 [Cantharellus anzutake]KAF8332107.1 hypothetical protein EI90DRAFT_925471 [Cantharellus anzutake]